MPNWCENQTQLVGPVEKVKKLWEEIQKKKELLAVIRPEPDYETTAVPRAFGPEGSADGTWGDWRVLNWGTKWDVDASVLSFDSYSDTGTIEGFFETAWSPPVEAFIYFGTKNPDFSISLRYHEPGMRFAGELAMYGGVVSANDYHEYGKCKSVEEVQNLIDDELDVLFGISDGLESEV
jgi:hypothetical protein